MIQLFIILQTQTNELPTGIIEGWLQYGVLGLAAVTFAVLFFLERKRNNDSSKTERERITNDIEKERLRMQAQLENGEQKAEVLYNELKETQKSYAERLSGIISKQNEIQERTVEIIEKNNTLYEKIINILISK